MSEWRQTTLGDVATVSWGDTTKTKAAYSADGVLAYSASGPDGFLPKADLRGDGVVISAIGAQCGKTWLARGEWSCIKNTMWFQAGRDADTRFLYYATSDPDQWPKRGAAQPFIGLGDARLLRLRLPPLMLQRRIASVLGALDDLIENNQRRAKVLEEMTRAIYGEWFVRFRHPGHESVPFVDSPLGPLPDGWAASTCGDQLTVLGGGTPSKEEDAYWDGGDVRWFTPSDLTRFGLRYAAKPKLRITLAGLARSSARLFPKGSVLMTSRATLGVLAITTFEATTNQGFIVIPPDDRWSPGFIYEWLDWHAEDLASVATGAIFKEITKGAFKRVPFVVPAQPVLNAHRKVTEPLEEQIRLLEEQNRCLVSLRQLLLPKLVTGKIDVSHLDLDALTEAAIA